MTNDLATTCSALPWLDQLHNIIACMYIGGGAHNRGHKDNVLVQINDDASFENPIISYSGVGEIERAFRGRECWHPRDTKTLLECVHVEASEDSGIGGAGLLPFSSHHHDNDESSSSNCNENEKNSIPSSSSISNNPLSLGNNNASTASPPTVEVQYILNQTYGSYVSVQSILVVTVQVRSGCCSKVQNQSLADKLKVGIPIATSSIGSSSGSSSNCNLSNIVSNGNGSQDRIQGISAGNASNQTLVAEVVRIEERWNGVKLMGFVPFFHWSRRLNGMVASGLAYLLFS